MARSIVTKTARLEALLASREDWTLAELARRIYGRNAGGARTRHRIQSLRQSLRRQGRAGA